MRLSDLLGKDVVSEAGWPFGRVVDVRVETGGRRATVNDLLVGRRALAERLLGGRQAEARGRTSPRSRIPWDLVVAVEPKRIVVRAETKLIEGGSDELA